MNRAWHRRRAGKRVRLLFRRIVGSAEYRRCKARAKAEGWRL